ncbi:BrnA antitoxin family protein [Roseateles sp.]|uniref:BrnA antitoxin family protein n=1 Tax=Roseateles sp. TaxID=1971397 RepID=UPI00326612EB
MRDQYDFSKAKRGAVLPSAGKTRITIMLDDDVLAHFRDQAEQAGCGYQTLVNAALRQVMQGSARDAHPLTVEELRKVLREELRVA